MRSTGQVNAITRQPVKGRKKGGGIRLGEMERDSLLSHGVSFCLQDRLMNCSDSHLAQVCMTCGGINSVYNMPIRGVGGSGGGSMNRGMSIGLGACAGGMAGGGGGGMKTPWKPQCRVCMERGEVRNVQMPYVYRYLANELAGMGIRLALTISD
ncbi:hypothetical protein EON65_22765 [archaeon]|nr:MAG: hypothetical protein EON65_22765 [archaeon]